jgi:hypothetical protein
MPGETVKPGGAEIVVPIWNIAAEIIRVVNCRNEGVESK